MRESEYERKIAWEKESERGRGWDIKRGIRRGVMDSKRAWGPAGVLNSGEVRHGSQLRGNIIVIFNLLYWLRKIRDDFNYALQIEEEIGKRPTQGYRDPNSAALLASAQENKTFVTHIRNIDTRQRQTG